MPAITYSIRVTFTARSSERERVPMLVPVIGWFGLAEVAQMIIARKGRKS